MQILNRIVCSVVIITVAGASQAQTSNELPPESRFYLQPGDVTELFGLMHQASDATKTVSKDNGPTKPLLVLISKWLAQNFDLPAIGDPPRVNLVDPKTMANLRRGWTGAESRTVPLAFNPLQPVDRNDESVAIYDDDTRTIYLPNGWTGRTAAETSILVHEMVHHLQNIAGEKFECPEAREKAAYSAQEAWLEMFGSTLDNQLNIDPFTQLVLSTCKY